MTVVEMTDRCTTRTRRRVPPALLGRRLFLSLVLIRRLVDKTKRNEHGAVICIRADAAAQCRARSAQHPIAFDRC